MHHLFVLSHGMAGATKRTLQELWRRGNGVTDLLPEKSLKSIMTLVSEVNIGLR